MDPIAVLGVSLLAGLGGALFMDVPMARLPEGLTPARGATAVLTGTDPDAVSGRRAWLVHHAFGLPAGGLFGGLYLVTVGVLGRAGAVLVADLVVVAFLYLFFSRLVLPLLAFPPERELVVRRSWVVSVAAFATGVAGLLAALLPLVA
jgi:hypothetical protein